MIAKKHPGDLVAVFESAHLLDEPSRTIQRDRILLPPDVFALLFSCTAKFCPWGTGTNVTMLKLLGGQYY